MKLEHTRFGTLNFDASAAISFPSGIIGFAEESSFLLIEREHGPLAYLQSLRTPALALPVIETAGPGSPYTIDDAVAPADAIGCDPRHLVILNVVFVEGADGVLCANQLGPIAIDAERRRGAQIILDPERFSTSTPIGKVADAPSAPAPFANANDGAEYAMAAGSSR